MSHLVVCAQCLSNNRLSKEILPLQGPGDQELTGLLVNNFAHTVMQFIFLKPAMIQSFSHKNEIFA